MKPHIKKKWIAALESGKFRKIENALHDGEEGNYCALGVLGHLYNEAHKSNPVDLQHWGSLPDRVANWAGIDDNGTFRRPFEVIGKSGNVLETYADIPDMNDSGRRGITFKCIAKAIKKNM